MKFNIKAEGQLISVDLGKNLENQLVEAVGKMAQDAIAVINARTVAGKDSENKSFTPYSKQYAKHRIREGRRASPVDLLWTGGMLRSMQWKTKVENARVIGEIFFADSTEAQKAGYLMVGVKRIDGKNSARNFFAFGEKLINRLSKIYRGAINFKEANK
jgi:hypothetical protein